MKKKIRKRRASKTLAMYTQHSLKDKGNVGAGLASARRNDGTNFTAGSLHIKDIALLVTIIMVIILAFALIIVIDNNNKNLDKIIYRAKKEAEQTLVSTGRIIYAEDIENYVGAHSVRPLSDENLPENTTSTPQGTVVLPKENWNIETVTAISVGNGDTVPVPIGFYYVGGDLETGVIISDDKRDEYDGETDKTTWEYTTKLKGNQFVWIPCTEEEYKKCEVWNGITQKPSGTNSGEGVLCNASWDKTTHASELPQIRKYGGFYIARYETGLAQTITEFTSTQQHTGSNQVYNVEGIPQSKAGIIPWIFIDWNHSQTNAKNMYNTASVSSGLITGTQWDVMLNKMVEKGAIQSSDLTSSGNWGNYSNNSIEYTGRIARAYLDSRQLIGAFGGIGTNKTTNYNTNLTGDLLTTGASKVTEKYHIYDIAGNVMEWTDEASLDKYVNANEINAQYRMMRGGSARGKINDVSACYRYGTYTYVSMTGMDVTFRVVLYIR